LEGYKKQKIHWEFYNNTLNLLFIPVLQYPRIAAK
jgi:hypothetical protein